MINARNRSTPDAPPRPPAAARRRAFALPLVVLLALVGSLAIVILLERQGAASLTVQRQIRAYEAHHMSFGVREMTSRFLRQLRGGVRANLDQDGHAFTLRFPGNSTVDVYFRDGQARCLADSSMLVGRRREIVDFMRGYLQSRVPPDQLPALLRPVGAPAISLRRAPRVVLEALATACVKPDEVEQVVDTLMRSFPDEQLSGDSQGAAAGAIGQASALGNVLADLDISDEARAELEAMLTLTPTLWKVIAVEPGPRGEPVWRAEGYMEMQGGFNAATYEQGGPFLTWEEVPPEEVADR